VPYLDLRGVDSYHEIAGDGPPVVLLHGGWCSLENLRPVAESLTPSYAVHAAERPGHGRTPDREGPFSYADAVADTLAYLDAVGLGDAHLVGYSDGAIIGLMLALDHPERVRSLVAISANIDPSGFVSEDRYARAVPTELVEITDREYAELSPDGPDHADAVAAKLHAMWTAEPNIPAAALTSVTAPTLVLAGQHDMVALEHTALIADTIPGAELGVVPGTSHLLVMERPELIGQLVREFLDARDPAQASLT
jgi:pimeloyl-ACP methyl ester carboxylesterase